ncbi:MAG: hydrogenase maturation protease, partial [Dehalococcoidia bacterium]|nr:hydrogenase maturation protease [Dehalococcoidia bacterium]
GMGNPLLCDDGVGLRVAAELKDRVEQPEITVMETGVAGLSLLDLLVGYERAIIIDAIQTVGGKAGQIYRLDPKAFDTALHTASAHGIDFTTALEFGKKLGLPLPQQIIIFAIEASDVSTFNEECTPEVQKAIPTCVEMVLQELKRG